MGALECRYGAAMIAPTVPFEALHYKLNYFAIAGSMKLPESLHVGDNVCLGQSALFATLFQVRMLAPLQALQGPIKYATVEFHLCTHIHVASQ